MKQWLRLLSEIGFGFTLAIIDTLRPSAVRAPTPPPQMTPMHDVWVSDGDGPLMHVGALTYSDAMRATVSEGERRRAA